MRNSWCRAPPPRHPLQSLCNTVTDVLKCLFLIADHSTISKTPIMKAIADITCANNISALLQFVIMCWNDATVMLVCLTHSRYLYCGNWYNRDSCVTISCPPNNAVFPILCLLQRGYQELWAVRTCVSFHRNWALIGRNWVMSARLANRIQTFIMRQRGHCFVMITFQCASFKSHARLLQYIWVCSLHTFHNVQ